MNPTDLTPEQQQAWPSMHTRGELTPEWELLLGAINELIRLGADGDQIRAVVSVAVKAAEGRC